MKKIILAWFLTLALCFSADAQVIWKNGNYATFLPKLGYYLFDGKFYSSLSVDPSAGGGVVALDGSLGVRDNAGVGELWLKEGAANTAWGQILSTNTGWRLVGNAGTTPGTNFLGTTDAQDLQFRVNSVLYSTYQANGGIYTSQAPIPADGLSKNEYETLTTVSPGVSTTTANNLAMFNHLQYDVPNNGYDYSGNLTALQNQTEIYGTGTIGQVYTNNNGATFSAVAGTTNTYRGNGLNANVGTGYTIGNFLGTESNVTSTGATITDASMFASSVNLTDITANSLNGLNNNLQVSGTSTYTGSINSIFSTVNFNDTASGAQIYGGYLSAAMHNASTISGGLTGETVLASTGDTSNVTGGVIGQQTNATATDSSTVGGVTGATVSATLSGAATAPNVLAGNFGTLLDNTAVSASAGALSISAQIQGTASTGNFYAETIGTNVTGNSVVNNLLGLGVSPVIQGSATATTFQPFYVNAQVQGTAVVTNGITVADISISTVPVIPNVTGLRADVANANVVSPFNKTAISANGGALTAGFGFDIPAATPFFVGDSLSVSPHVALGVPTDALAFGLTMGASVQFDDDWTPETFANLNLGYSVIGNVGQIVGAAGKTMDAWNGMLSGFSNPSGNGTLTTARMFAAAGALPAGGALSITNMVGFDALTSLCSSSPTNCWGVRVQDPIAKNLFVGTIETDNALILQDPGAGTNTWTIKSPTLAADYVLTLPVDDGLANQVLATDGAGVTSWASVAISPLTTKGDLWGYGAADTRVPVGADGDVLTADSANPNGVSWQPPSATGTPNVSTKVANYTALTSDDVILVDATAGPVTITLFAATTKKILYIKKIDQTTNDVTIVPNGGDTIESDVNLTITDPGVDASIVSDGGTAWYVL